MISNETDFKFGCQKIEKLFHQDHQEAMTENCE